jgi:hypothetical protein
MVETVLAHVIGNEAEQATGAVMRSINAGN